MPAAERFIRSGLLALLVSSCGSTNAPGGTPSGGSGADHSSSQSSTGGAEQGGSPSSATGGTSAKTSTTGSSPQGGATNAASSSSKASGGSSSKQSSGLGGEVSTGVGGISAVGGVSSVPVGGSASGGATEDAGTSSPDMCSISPPSRHEAAYPDIDESAAKCGAWVLEDNVCCAQYCSDDPASENCDKCKGTDKCVPVNSKGCVSGEWPEVHCLSDNEAWHYSRSTHYGVTNGGACAFGYYGLCTTADKFKFTDPIMAAKCDAFCKAYPSLCQDPVTVSLRGNFAAPQGNYYTQFWPSLPGDRDNYLSCGECFEMIRTKPDGSEYQPGEAGYTQPIVLQVTDSCPCSANSKWCCGSGRDHCAEVKSSTLNFEYGCPLPPGDLAADHDPQPNESIHLDLSDIAMARLQQGDPNKGIIDGVIPTKYRRVDCPVVGNIYIWLLSGASDYYFAMAAVNAAGPGSIVKIEAQLKSGNWVAMQRDANYTSARPQERYGTWVVPQGAGQFALPLSLRFTSPNGKTVEAPGAIKAWAPTDPNQDKEMYYVDTGVQF